jgi:hypothetical protein
MSLDFLYDLPSLATTAYTRIACVVLVHEY